MIINLISLAFFVPILNRDKNVSTDVRTTTVVSKFYINLHLPVFVYLFLKNK